MGGILSSDTPEYFVHESSNPHTSEEQSRYVEARELHTLLEGDDDWIVITRIKCVWGGKGLEIKRLFKAREIKSEDRPSTEDTGCLSINGALTINGASAPLIVYKSRLSPETIRLYAGHTLDKVRPNEAIRVSHPLGQFLIKHCEFEQDEQGYVICADEIQLQRAKLTFKSLDLHYTRFEDTEVFGPQTILKVSFIRVRNVRLLSQ